MKQMHPAAAAVWERLQRLVDQGKVCPLCGGALAVINMSAVASGMYDGMPAVELRCDAGDWAWDPEDDIFRSEQAAYYDAQDLDDMREDPDWCGR
jgi:hypothetical protein